MKKRLRELPIAAAILLIGCQKEVNHVNQPPERSAQIARANADFVNTFYGPEIHLGDGKIRSWIKISHDEVPQAIGLEMTSGVFQGLPEEYTDMVIPLHQKATDLTPYDHFEVGWMPHGHPPGYFQPPHFDIHFYMLTLEEQMMIPVPNATNTSLASTAAFGKPSPGILPTDYTVASAAVPMMGRHWLDKNASVLPPVNALFTHQFIYGTYDNKVVFVEPMVTRAFLMSGVEVHNAIKQPTIFNPTGKYYPTGYNIYHGDTKTYISLDQFVLR